MNDNTCEDDGDCWDSMDYGAAVIDEVALEGLDGITLQALWVRLGARRRFCLATEACRPLVWSVVTSHGQLQLYQLPAARAPLQLVNRFDSLDDDLGVVVEPKVLPPDPYPLEPVDDQSSGVRGSCATYSTRLPLPDAKHLSLAEAEQKYGDTLVVVASQQLREASLVPSRVLDVRRELSLSQYLQLERIGRSRYHGEVTIGAQGLCVLKDTPKNLYYIRKKLIELNLITKQNFYMRLRNGIGSQGRLYHIPRFFCEFRPKYVYLIEQCVEILRRQPHYMLQVSEVASLLDNRHSLRKVAKHSDFQQLIKYEAVPYRKMFPEAPHSQWRVKSSSSAERTVRVYRLLDPQVDVRKALDQEEDAEGQNTSAQDQLKFPDQSCVSLVNSLERQAYVLLLKHGPTGISVNDLRRELGQSQLDSRALMKAIASVPGATFTYRQDMGKIRITRYVASCFSHLSTDRHNITMEETILKSLADDSAQVDTSLTAYQDMSLWRRYDSASVSPPRALAVCQDLSVVGVVPVCPADQSAILGDTCLAISQEPSSAVAPPSTTTTTATVAATPDDSLSCHESSHSGQLQQQEQQEGPEKQQQQQEGPEKQQQQQQQPEKQQQQQEEEMMDQDDAVGDEKVLSAGSEMRQEGGEAVQSLPIPSCPSDVTDNGWNIVDRSEFHVKAGWWLLELFDPLSGERLSESVHVPLQETDLFTKWTSSRHMRRTRLVLQTVKKMRIVDQSFHLKRVILAAEGEDKMTSRIDRRSFYRILKQLADARLLRNFRLTLDSETVSCSQRHLVTDYSVDFEDKLLQSIVLDKLSNHLLNSKASAAASTAACTPLPTALPEPLSNSPAAADLSRLADEEADPQSPREENSNECGLLDSPDKGASDKPHPEAVRCPNNMHMCLPKYRRLQLLHSLLFYMCRDYDGDTDIDQAAAHSAIWRQFPELFVDAPAAGGEPLLAPHLCLPRLPHVFRRVTDVAAERAAAHAALCADLDSFDSGGARATVATRHVTAAVTWTCFISPLPVHAGWGDGWLLLRDVLMRLPLCVFVRLVRCVFVCPLMITYLEHPLLRHLPVSELPPDILHCLRWKRRYMFAVHEDIVRLCFMGLVQLGTQLIQKDQLFVYLNRNACLLDTVSSAPALYTVETGQNYPTRFHHFSRLATVTDYWSELKSISLCTPLGIRKSAFGKKFTAISPFDKDELLAAACERSADEVEGLDTGRLPGDRLGAAGIDSSMFTHFIKNWRELVNCKSITETLYGLFDDYKRRATDNSVSEQATGHKSKSRRVTFSNEITAEAPYAGHVTAAAAASSRRQPDTVAKRQISAVSGDVTPAPVPKRHRYIGAGGSGARTAAQRKSDQTARQRKSDEATPSDTVGGVSANEAKVGGATKLNSRGRAVPRKSRQRFVKPRERKRLPAIDDVDQRALSKLTKSRCTWSVRESRFLLLARVALQLLSNCLKVPARQYNTTRDALHAAFPESMDKTTMAVRRRMKFVLRKPSNAAHASLLYQEYRHRADVKNIIGDQPFSQSYVSQSVLLPRKFNQLMSLLRRQCSNPTDTCTGPVLPHQYWRIREEFDLYEGDPTLLDTKIGCINLQDEHDIMRHTVTWFIMGYLSSSDDKSPSTAAVYHTLLNYPETVNVSALHLLLQLELVCRRKRRQHIRHNSRACTRDTHPALYTLSIRYRNRLITRYQYRIFCEMYLWYKTLLLNSLTKCFSPEGATGEGTSACLTLSSVASGGDAAAMVSLLLLDKLEYEVIVPENVIALGEIDKETLRSEETDAEDEDVEYGGRVPLSASTPLCRISNSRVVLMTMREQQVSESMLPNLEQSRQNGYVYHEQLTVTACEINMRHVTLENPNNSELPPAAGPPTCDTPSPSPPAAAPENQSEPSRIAVNGAYLLVTPGQVNQVTQRHTRYVRLTADEAVRADLCQLTADLAWSSLQLGDARRLLQLLHEAGMQGVECSRLPSVSGIADRAWLCRLVTSLCDRDVIVLAGDVTRRAVSRQHADCWLLHSYHVKRLAAESLSSADLSHLQLTQIPGVEQVRYLPAPWRRVGGSLCRRVLDRFLAIVVSHCVQSVGASLASVQRHFTPQLSPCHVSQLVEDLSIIGAVKLTEQTVTYQPSLFSSRDDVQLVSRPVDLCSPVANIIIQPVREALLLVACFIGDKSYSRDFLADTGM